MVAPVVESNVKLIDWQANYAGRTRRMASSAIRELLKLTAQRDIISFAGGLPAPEMFPVREFQEACDYVLRNEGPKALQYGETEGYGRGGADDPPRNGNCRPHIDTVDRSDCRRPGASVAPPPPSESRKGSWRVTRRPAVR